MNIVFVWNNNSYSEDESNEAMTTGVVYIDHLNKVAESRRIKISLHENSN